METERNEFELAENSMETSYSDAILRAIYLGEKDLREDPVIVDKIYKSVDDLKKDNLHREAIDLPSRSWFSKEVAISWINLWWANALMRNLDKFDWLDLEVAKRLAIKGVLHTESYSYQELEVLFWVDSYLISYLIDCSERIHDCEEEIDSVIKEINSYCNWFEPRNLWIDDEKIEYTAREFWNHEIIY